MNSAQITEEDLTPLPKPIPGLISNPDDKQEEVMEVQEKIPTAVEQAFNQLNLTFTPPFTPHLESSEEEIETPPTPTKENPVNNNTTSPEEASFFQDQPEALPPPDYSEARRPNKIRTMSRFRRFKRKVDYFHFEVAPWIGWAALITALVTGIIYGIPWTKRMYHNIEAYRRFTAQQAVVVQNPATSPLASPPAPTVKTEIPPAITAKPVEDQWIKHKVEENEWSIPILRQYGYKKGSDQQAAFKLMLDEPRNAKIKQLTNDFNNLSAGQEIWIPKTLQAIVAAAAK